MNKKIGALWLKKTKDGKQYFSGVLTDMRGDIPVVVFRNDKKKDKQPDFQIFISEPQKKQEEVISQPEDIPQGEAVDEGEIDVNEIPY